MQALIRHTSPSTPFSHWIAKFPSICPQPRPCLFRFPSVWTLKSALNCGRFADDYEVKKRCMTGFVIKQKPFFNSIKKLCVREKSTDLLRNRAFRLALCSIHFLNQCVPERASWRWRSWGVNLNTYLNLRFYCRG